MPRSFLWTAHRRATVTSTGERARSSFSTPTGCSTLLRGWRRSRSLKRRRAGSSGPRPPLLPPREGGRSVRADEVRLSAHGARTPHPPGRGQALEDRRAARDPSKSPVDAVERRLVQLRSIDGVDTVLHHHAGEVLRGGDDRGRQHTAVRVDPRNQQRVATKLLECELEIGGEKAVVPALASNDHVPVGPDAGHELRTNGSRDVVRKDVAARHRGSRDRSPERVGCDFVPAAVLGNTVDDGDAVSSSAVQKGTVGLDNPSGGLSLERQGGDLHVEMAAVQIDGQDGGCDLVYSQVLNGHVTPRRGSDGAWVPHHRTDGLPRPRGAVIRGARD